MNDTIHISRIAYINNSYHLHNSYFKVYFLKLVKDVIYIYIYIYIHIYIYRLYCIVNRVLDVQINIQTNNIE